jgi:hypothetical protein
MNIEDVYLFVDTALSWDEHFDWPVPEGSVFVEIDGPYGPVIVCVHARYTKPDIEQALTIAVDAYHEREGGEIWAQMGATMGGPFYHCRIVEVVPYGDEPAIGVPPVWTSYLVRLVEDDWEVEIED